MIITKLILASIIFPIFVGYIIISSFAQKEELYFLEKIAISYGIGVGIVSLLMFILGNFFIPLTVPNILLASFFLLLYPFYLSLKKKNLFNPKLPNLRDLLFSLKWYEYLIISIIILRLILVYFQAIIRPVEDIDSIAYRMMEAKIFFIEKSLSLNVSPGYFIGPSSRKNYPLNIPLFASWTYSALGTWDDALVNIIFPTFLSAFAIAFYYLMRRIANRTASLFSTYLLLSLPFLIYHASTSYIDAVVAFYYCLSFIYLLLFIRERNHTYLIVSALLGGISTWTKSEGLPLILSNLIILGYYLFSLNKDKLQEKFYTFLKYLTPILLFSIPWYTFLYIYRAKIPPSGEIPNFSQLFSYYNRIPTIIEFFYRKAFFYGNWNIAWFVFLIVTIISVARKRIKPEQLFAFFAVIFGMVIFGSVYCLTGNWEHLLDGTIQNRNFLTFTPLIIYFIAFSVFNGENNILKEDENVCLENSSKPKKKNAYARNKKKSH